jgi:hypothetical protein
MVVGFNHNFRYKGGLYHVQTEDGGLKSPNIVTLLYCGGTILASQKTSYSDITKVNNLPQVVEDLMKEQHKEMLRRLKDGEFDDRLKDRSAVVNPAVDPDIRPTPQPAPEPAPVISPVVAPAVVDEPPAAAVLVEEPTPVSVPVAEEVKKKPAAVLGLDDIILSYLVDDDK